MRSILVLSLAAATFAAPPNLAEWGSAISRWGSWFESTSPIPSVLDYIRTTNDDRNIYDMLKASPEYTRLIKLVDMHKDVVDLLKTNDKRITFFAANNDALPHKDEDMINLIMRSTKGGDDEKKRFREMVRQALLYNILPQDHDTSTLPNNSTYATELSAEDGSFGGYKRRIKVESQLLPPALKLNNFARVVTSYHAKNGIVHSVDHALFPPPDIMDALFLFPNTFSQATSALLKTDLEDELEFNSRHSGHNKHQGQWPIGGGHHSRDRGKPGYPATTFFAPTNDAFNKLPNDLIAYLFSPYGEKTLRKLMQFHTVPDYAVYTEWIRHIKSKEQNQDNDRRSHSAWFSEDGEFSVDLELATLAKQKLPIHIKKTKSKVPGIGYNWEFKVHGIDVESRDNVAQNGAIHVVGTILCPRHKGATDAGRDEKDWSEWQQWLVDWARSDE